MHSDIVKQSEPQILFISYAHEDESLLQELEKYLSMPKRQGLIRAWHNQRIGAAWAKVNNELLEQASIILLLVSPDFLASSDCYQIATQTLQRQKTDSIPVIPILLCAVDLRDVPFELRALLPSNGKPITEWTDRDAAFDAVIRGILATITDKM